MGDIVGSVFGFMGAKEQAKASQAAAQTSANAQLEAARIAAEEARFRPIGITTRFGTSEFGYDPTTGRVSTAGYTVSPELKAYQDRIMELTGQGLGFAEQAPGLYAPLQTAATGLFGLGQQYLAESPEQAAQRYIAQQQELLAPSRERQFAQLQNRLFQTGRGGLSVGATGERPSGAAGLGATTPEMEAYYNALAQQDRQLAAQAMQAGQQQTQFGAGLFGTGAGLLGGYGQGLTGAYAPFATGLGTAGQIEALGMEPLNIGAQLGGRIASSTGAQALLSGGLGAARTLQGPMSYSPTAGLLQSLGRSVSGYGGFGIGSTGAAPTFGSFDPYSYLPNMPGNPYISDFTGSYNPLAIGGLE
jgi:hypothetical protein